MRYSFVLIIAATLGAQTADQIVTRAVDAMGGADRFAAIHSLKITGAIDGSAITVRIQRPTSFRVDIEGFAQGWDGKKGWSQASGKTTELTGAQLNQLKDQAFDAIGGPLVEAHQRGNIVESEGHETRDGRDLLKLKITLPTGTVIHWSLDPATYLEVHEQLVAGQTIEEDVGGFRKFGDLLFPCRFVSQVKGDSATHELMLRDIEINPSLPEGIFAMPSAVP